MFGIRIGDDGAWVKRYDAEPGIVVTTLDPQEALGFATAIAAAAQINLVPADRPLMADGKTMNRPLRRLGALVREIPRKENR